MTRWTRRTFARYLLLAPSLFFGLVGGVWLYLRPFPYEANVTWLQGLLVSTTLVAALLGGAWFLEKTLPSFRYAQRLMQRALAPLTLSLPTIFLLAAVSSVAEEVFFRGALLPAIGVWGQALLFGLMHPATRKGWSYTAFTFVAGLAFGYATLLTGILWPAVLAHFVVNFQGFWELRCKRIRKSPSSLENG